ncbi:MAG: methyltransferase domain-containing protein [Patescibacteria group bacterium]|nr:methyltransferase domain-containing protein [Patescibacteria group bacterium]
MFAFLIYFLILIFLLFFLIFMTIYIISLIYSSLKGSPYVATKNQRINEILKNASLKKGKIFIELGSGDGRVLREAVKKYKVIGIGFDINPLLVYWSKILSFGIKNIEFKIQDILKADLKKADYLYLFLMPELIEKLRLKMNNELKKGTIVISHGFKIQGWEKKLFKTIKSNPFWTFYYKK